MNLIEFKDYPSTETPLNAENLNHNFNEIVALMEALKTIELGGGWMYAVAVGGGATRLRLPIINPENKSVSISGVTGQYFDNFDGKWKDLTNLQVSCFGKTYVELAMDAGENTQSVLVKLYGTIQVK